MTFSLTIKTAEDIETEGLTSLRSSASVTKYQFCKALIDYDILTLDDAVAAAQGAWPQALDGFLSYLTAREAADARMEWASSVKVHRTNDLVLILGSYLGLADQQVDAMFDVGKTL